MLHPRSINFRAKATPNQAIKAVLVAAKADQRNRIRSWQTTKQGAKRDRAAHHSPRLRGDVRRAILPERQRQGRQRNGWRSAKQARKTLRPQHVAKHGKGRHDKAARQEANGVFHRFPLRDPACPESKRHAGMRVPTGCYNSVMSNRAASRKVS